MRKRLVTQRPTVWRYQADAQAALASYQEVAASRRGRVVLWACPPDGGAGGVLQGLGGLLGQITPAQRSWAEALPAAGTYPRRPRLPLGWRWRRSPGW